MQKRKTEKFLSAKNSPKNGDFTRFPGKFPVFAVLIYPPGANPIKICTPNFASKVNV